jgi:hypothetical protein
LVRIQDYKIQEDKKKELRKKRVQLEDGKKVKANKGKGKS